MRDIEYEKAKRAFCRAVRRAKPGEAIPVPSILSDRFFEDVAKTVGPELERIRQRRMMVRELILD